MSLLKIMPSFRHQYEYYRNICKYMICRKNRHYKRDGDRKNESFGCTCTFLYL